MPPERGGTLKSTTWGLLVSVAMTYKYRFDGRYPAETPVWGEVGSWNPIIYHCFVFSLNWLQDVFHQPYHWWVAVSYHWTGAFSSIFKGTKWNQHLKLKDILSYLLWWWSSTNSSIPEFPVVESSKATPKKTLLVKKRRTKFLAASQFFDWNLGKATTKIQ